MKCPICDADTVYDGDPEFFRVTHHKINNKSVMHGVLFRGEKEWVEEIDAPEMVKFNLFLAKLYRQGVDIRDIRYTMSFIFEGIRMDDDISKRITAKHYVEVGRHW
jgi:hypothetical protein